MGKRQAILVFIFFISAAVPAAETARQALLQDGFVLRGVDGMLIGPDSNDAWFFEFSSDVNDFKVVVKAGTRLELLPSSGLERMTADMKIRPAATYRLWNGRVTKYRGRNFIFPDYFLPLSKAGKPQPEISQEPQQKQGGSNETPFEQERQPTVDEPNSILAIPQDILERLKSRREKIADSGQRIVETDRVPADKLRPTGGKEELPSPKHYTESSDSIFVDRTALLVQRDDDRFVFVPDALGRSAQRLSLWLLPCEALELTERKQSEVPDPVRFKIAGIMTKYKGKNYLLLQKATRTYSHGNFGR